MKRFLPFCLAVLLLAISQLPVTAATLTVRADSYPPYNGTPGDAKPGYVVEILKAIFEPQGITVDYQIRPWSRTLEEVKKGTFDAAIAGLKADMDTGVFPQEACGMNRLGVYVLAGNSWKYSGPDDLKHIKLGIIEGYTYSDEIMGHLRANKPMVFTVNGDDPLPKLTRMLQAGRIDAFVENPDVVAYYLRSAGLGDKIVTAGDASGAKIEPLYVIFSPGKPTSRDYAAKYDEGLRKFRQSGKLREILAAYGLKDWK